MKQERSASILVCVMVAMSVVTALAACMTRTALQTRRQMLVYRQLRQTELLLQAGVERAIDKLRIAPSYSGETWNLSPETLPSWDSAQVAIEIAPVAQGEAIRVQVMARLPASSKQKVQRSHTLSIQLPSLSEKE